MSGATGLAPERPWPLDPRGDVFCPVLAAGHFRAEDSTVISIERLTESGQRFRCAAR